MELGGTRGDYHPVKIKVLNIFENFGLAGFGTSIEVMATDRHMGEPLRPGYQFFGTEDPGDIEAAVANIQADAEIWFHESRGYQVSASSRGWHAADVIKKPGF
jgi:hypothetical protein